MKRIALFVCLCAWFAPAARAQSFTLSVVNGPAVGTSYNFGNVPPGVVVSASFQLQNTSTAAATLTVLALGGPAAFSISSAPFLQQTLKLRATVRFTINFQGTVTGFYSAFRFGDGINALLTAAIVPGLS